MRCVCCIGALSRDSDEPMPADKSIRDHIHTQQGEDNAKCHTDSLEMSDENGRKVPGISKEIAERENILLAVDVCEQASQRHRKIR